MSSTTTESPAAGEAPTVQGVLNSIADDLEKHGHYQKGMSLDDLWNGTLRKGLCCLIANPTNNRIQINYFGLGREVEAEIRRRISDPNTLKPPSLVEYSDNTPTEQVIAMLRAEQ